jgi:hypothetical protein
MVGFMIGRSKNCAKVIDKFSYLQKLLYFCAQMQIKYETFYPSFGHSGAICCLPNENTHPDD